MAVAMTKGPVVAITTGVYYIMQQVLPVHLIFMTFVINEHSERGRISFLIIAMRTTMLVAVRFTLSTLTALTREVGIVQVCKEHLGTGTTWCTKLHRIHTVTVIMPAVIPIRLSCALVTRTFTRF